MTSQLNKEPRVVYVTHELKQGTGISSHPYGANNKQAPKYQGQSSSRHQQALLLTIGLWEVRTSRPKKIIAYQYFTPGHLALKQIPSSRQLPAKIDSPIDTPTKDKAQPWKGLFPLMSSGNDAGQAPWKTWKPQPDAPDQKPWYQWMNDGELNPSLGKKVASFSDEERGCGMQQHPTRKRSSATQGTVAEGGYGLTTLVTIMTH
ncbi:hypothetical protein B0T24DRAFT_596568 [Lasiosphaeria ovina]|uniref:Uncharacterized protein n=1 Tax=Lasiosphaeria ovina TaxID=92902 RepID=A0AAE0JYF5_9PEZI|nr:hypothetical protein B0T24DRAFT_596568 [Lasiosphaeria ovina]